MSDSQDRKNAIMAERRRAIGGSLSARTVKVGDRVGDLEIVALERYQRPRKRAGDLLAFYRCASCGFTGRARVDNLRASLNVCRWSASDPFRHRSRPRARITSSESRRSPLR